MVGQSQVVPVTDVEPDLAERTLRLREKLQQRTKSFTPTGEFSDVLVSVIVLNLNGEHVLERCLNCLLDQQHPNVEILVLDNGSSDKSTLIVEAARKRGNVSLLISPTNLGVAGGRNFAMKHAAGEVIAFIDNDGFADPLWISAGLSTLLSEDDIGAAAATVFFNRNKLVLNGAGGFIDVRGYAGDHCFSVPYEFASIPKEVAYPMGCGMFLRRVVAEKVFPLDSFYPRWFDDTELGIRVWCSGFRVKVASNSFVDHDFHYSGRQESSPGWKRTLAFESARVRQCLKYTPLPKFPAWVWAELRGLCSQDWRRSVLTFIAYFNALLGLSSIRPIRRAWRQKTDLPVEPINRTVKVYPPPTPNDQELHLPHHYGWFNPERGFNDVVRWTAAQASTLVRADASTKALSLRYFSATFPYLGRIILREFGEIEPQAELILTVSSVGWQFARLALNVRPGLYEIIIVSETTTIDDKGRTVGIAVAELSCGV